MTSITLGQTCTGSQQGWDSVVSGLNYHDIHSWRILKFGVITNQNDKTMINNII